MEFLKNRKGSVILLAAFSSVSRTGSDTKPPAAGGWSGGEEIRGGVG